MAADDKVGQHLVDARIRLVLDDAKDVEPRQDRLGELDVLTEGNCRVVAPADRVGSSDDGAAGLQRGDDASLRDGDALLLHGFVDGGSTGGGDILSASCLHRVRNGAQYSPVGVVHLVKLVDQADTLVRQDERPTLETPLARDGVLPHARRQTDGTCALARRKHGAVRRLLDILEHLRLGRTRVTEQKHVDVATDAMLPVDVLGHAAKEGQGDGGLDVVVAVNRRRHRLDDTLADAFIAREIADRLLVLLRKTERRKEVLLLVDVVRLEDGRKDGEAVFDIERGIEVVAVDARNLNLVAGLGRIDQVPEQNDLAVAGKTTGRD